MATVTRLMTEEEFLALPDDDDVERWLVRGELVELPMTMRGFSHSVIEARVSQVLLNWSDEQPIPQGSVLCGEGRVRLKTDPTSFVGVDVAYFPPETHPEEPNEARHPDGLPLLVVEILSPTDRMEDVKAKVRLYLEAGVPIVWVLDHWLKAVTIHGRNDEVRLVTRHQEIDAEPHLPGFKIVVERLFRGVDVKSGRR